MAIRPTFITRGRHGNSPNSCVSKAGQFAQLLYEEGMAIRPTLNEEGRAIRPTFIIEEGNAIRAQLLSLIPIFSQCFHL